MRFELKVFLSIMVIFIVSLSIINFVNLFIINEIFLKYESLYNRVYPDFLTNITQKDISTDLKEKYSRVILIWEGILVIGTSLLLYLIIDRFLKKEQRYKTFLQLIILSISHKFGNNLSSIITNLEILKQKESSPSLDRIEKAISLLSEDIKTLTEIFKNLPIESRKEEYINIQKKFIEILNKFNPENKKIFLYLKPLRKYLNKTDLDIIIYNLLENSFKYSNKYIHIKMLKKCLIIKNDINQETKGGSGIGLLIVENLCNLNNIKFKKRVSKRSFIVILDFS